MLIGTAAGLTLAGMVLYREDPRNRGDQRPWAKCRAILLQSGESVVATGRNCEVGRT